MAVGDVVSALGALNTTLIYQPAAGVETMISSFGSGGGAWCYVTDGITLGYLQMSAGASNQFPLLKVFVNNTLYLHMSAGGAGSANNITGIQIK
jgi:hypothetical protein